MMQLMGLGVVQGGAPACGAAQGTFPPCNLIPIGDPYRQPGNLCAGVNGQLSFSSDGSLTTAGSLGPPVTAADMAPPFSPMTMFGFGAAAMGALGVLVWFFKRR